MDRVYQEYKRQQLLKERQFDRPVQDFSNLDETVLNTQRNAAMSDKGQQLNQIIEELGIDVEGGYGSGVGVMRQETRLSNEERQYLLGVERGDNASVKNFIEKAADFQININCVDPLGRNALLIAIENEHIELLELLLTYNLELGDALLHAISEENLEAVEIILNTQNERQNKKNLSGSVSQPQQLSPSQYFVQEREAAAIEKGFLGGVPSSSFTPDITPIILAAHRDNYEIIKLLLDRGDRIPKPHELRCNCQECALAHKEDSLRHSKSRINAYRALASPSLIALSSKDPVLTAFELSWELRQLGRLENEFKSEYEELANRCQTFATALLEQTRGSDELAIVLNHDVGQTNPTNISSNARIDEGGERMTLARLKLAIKYKQKEFVAHPHCQQLLASLWYEGLPGFRRKPFLYKASMIIGFGAMFPLLSIAYLLTPKSKVGGIVRKPFIKFLCHSASYVTFLLLLILQAVRFEDIVSTPDEKKKYRGENPAMIEWIIVVYIAGFIWQEVKQLWSDGVKAYVSDMWNLLDFATNSLYVATITLRTVAYFRVQQQPSLATIDRDRWDSYDPTLISECLFAAANIFSMLKLVYIFTVNPHLGPLQISLGRMLNDILKFFCVYMLVLVAFACGLNQLLWFYSKKRRETCKSFEVRWPLTGQALESYSYCITRGRYFTNLFEITQSLYWALYGLIDLENMNLEYKHEFTEFIGKLMFGVYSAIGFVVLVNMLIAMMNTSYQIIAEKADVEWKFARSKLWINYFDDGGTLTVPFNIIPSPKSGYYFFMWCKGLFCSCTKQHKRSKWQSIRKIVKKVNEKEARYQSVMSDLIKRYLMCRQKAEDNQGVTEDDLNEIKGDISAFRFELLEILKMNGMKTPAYSEKRAAKLRRRGSKRSLSRLSRKLDFDSVSSGAASPDSTSGNIGNVVSANGGPRARKSAVERRIARNASSNLGSISENSDFASSRENSFDSDSGVGSAANPVWIKRQGRCDPGNASSGGEMCPEGNGVSSSTGSESQPPTYQKASTMPELTLDPTQLSSSSSSSAVYPARAEKGASGSDISSGTKVTDSPFNKKAGAIKKVSFNWHQETDEKSEPPTTDTYVYDGAMKSSTASSDLGAKGVAPTPSTKVPTATSKAEPSSAPPKEAEVSETSQKERRSDLV